MSNAILIKEVNNQPVIFNVDNAIDAARLEALQAVKMEEEMAAEIFGENAQYADILNSSISDNPDNPAFPFTVVFDSSKIPEKPKRDLAAMAGLAMPSDKYIELVLSLNNAKAIWGPAPADGYFQIRVRGGENVNTSISLGFNSSQGLKNNMSSAMLGSGIGALSTFLPVRKGDMVPYWAQGSGMFGFFIYAEGTI